MSTRHTLRSLHAPEGVDSWRAEFYYDPWTRPSWSDVAPIDDPLVFDTPERTLDSLTEAQLRAIPRTDTTGSGDDFFYWLRPSNVAIRFDPETGEAWRRPVNIPDQPWVALPRYSDSLLEFQIEANLAFEKAQVGFQRPLVNGNMLLDIIGGSNGTDVTRQEMGLVQLGTDPAPWTFDWSAGELRRQGRQPAKAGLSPGVVAVGVGLAVLALARQR